MQTQNSRRRARPTRRPWSPALFFVSARSVARAVRGGGALDVCTRVHAIEQTYYGDNVASMAWKIHAIEQAASGLSALALSRSAFARARAALQPSGPWAAARESPSARRAARRPERLETAVQTSLAILPAAARRRFTTRVRYATAHH